MGHLDRMELRHLRYFVALAEELHVTRASRRLGISQPALSQQIRALEDELGAVLFHRTSRRVGLTEAGRLSLPEARAALAQAERAAMVARRAGRGEIGELRVGLYPSAPLLPSFARAVQGFRARLPGIHLNLTEMATGPQIAALRRGTLDIGVLRCAERHDIPPDLHAHEFAREPLVVVMLQDHPLAACPVPVAALDGLPLVFFSESVVTTLHAQLHGLCQRAGFVPRIVQEARENTTLMGLVGTGIGVTVVPLSLTRIRIDGVVHQPLLAEGAETATWITWADDAASEAARLFAAAALRSAG